MNNQDTKKFQWSKEYKEALLNVAREISNVYNTIDRTIFVAMPGVNNKYLDHYLLQIQNLVTTSEKKYSIGRLGLEDCDCYINKTNIPKRNYVVLYRNAIVDFLNKTSKDKIVVIDYVDSIVSELTSLSYNCIPIVMKPNLYSILTSNMLKPKSKYNPIFFTEENCRYWVRNLLGEAIDNEQYYYVVAGANFELIQLRMLKGKKGAVEDIILSSI